ncbi:hypothetical protein FVB9288_01684 [Flavobacterium sp. CECT 9288]|nr:hypothetical protein FVB9288_01684 [Flavobacterium sp. CECT 9288]
MPISDNPNYSEGHFRRVYEHIIIPACEIAGFKAIRADDIINTNFIAIDIIKRIIESDMAICDLSSQNPNVLYELGIRQAFDKPVTLIKDSKTKRIFDIQGFRDFEYDENLRVDNVQLSIESLAETIKLTYESNDSEINSLVTLLSLKPAEISKTKEITIDTELILNTLSSLERKIENIESSNNNNNRSSLKTRSNEIYYATNKFYGGLVDENIKEGVFKIGDFYTLPELRNLTVNEQVFHDKFGLGKIISIDEVGSTAIKDLKGEIQFNDGVKKLLLRFARLRKII